MVCRYHAMRLSRVHEDGTLDNVWLAKANDLQINIEMNLHLGYWPGDPKPPGQVDERNGASGKTVVTDRGPVRVDLPRDRGMAASSRS